MPAPSIVRSTSFTWAAGQPLAAGGSFNATGANQLVIIFSAVQSGISWDPTCSYAGVAATLIGSSKSENGGCIWMWSVPSPTTGTNSILVSNSNYITDGVVSVTALSDAGAAAVGNFQISATNTTATTVSVVATSAESIFVGLATSVYNPGVTASGSPSPTTLINHTTASHQQAILTSQASVSVGTTVTLTSTVVYNFSTAALVEILPSAPAGPTLTINSLSQTLTLGAAAVSTALTVPPLAMKLTVGSGTDTSSIVLLVSPLTLNLGLGGTARAVTVGAAPVVGMPALPFTLAPGESATLTIRYRPLAVGAHNGVLTINSNDPASPRIVSLSGTGVSSLLPLHTAGNQIVNSLGQNVRLMSTNYHGAEGENYIPHGHWIRRYTDMLDQIRSMGFNCIRVPFSGAWGHPGLTPPTTAFSAVLNPEFVGKTVLQVMDIIFDYCRSIGLYVVLDHHRRQPGAGADGGPIGSGYTEADWQATWAVLANRWKNHAAVVGADLHNEPYNLTWDAWATLATACGNSILTIAPNWLIFVEGVGNDGSDYYWWGGHLKGVSTRPVVLSIANRLVYSPHTYGQSVGYQTWQARDGYTPANWPLNQYAVWRDNWGFIFENNIAPIWIGEMGGFFGLDGNGALTKPHGPQETIWMTELVKYMNGAFGAGGAAPLVAPKKGMSFAWWTYSPLSVDTGGLIQDDWTTPQQPKLNLIAPLLA